MHLSVCLAGCILQLHLGLSYWGRPNILRLNFVPEKVTLGQLQFQVMLSKLVKDDT